MPKVDYRKVSANVSRVHNSRGWAVIGWDGEQAADRGVCINVTADIEVLARPGSNLNPLDVRRYIGHYYTDRRIQRESGLIWTAYDRSSDTSYVGMGAVIAPDVAERVKKAGMTLLFEAPKKAS